MTKNIIYSAFAVITLAAVSVLGLAANNADQEIATATTHAQMASDAANARTAAMHFHHVINCLVGPKSKLFDAAVGNPCNDMGNGALNDVEKKSATYGKLERALALAEQATKAKDLAATQEFAARISKVLKSINLNDY